MVESSLPNEMIAAVRAHAEAHYEEGGWDILVECMDNDEIFSDIGNAQTIEEAITNVGKVLGICDDHRKDVQATAFLCAASTKN